MKTYLITGAEQGLERAFAFAFALDLAKDDNQLILIKNGVRSFILHCQQF